MANHEAPQPPEAGIGGQEPSLQVEVTADEAKAIHATLVQLAQFFRENAPANAQRASKVEETTDPAIESPDEKS